MAAPPGKAAGGGAAMAAPAPKTPGGFQPRAFPKRPLLAAAAGENRGTARPRS